MNCHIRVWTLCGYTCVSVSRLLKHGIQSSAVVLQDPVGHAPQERVWVRYDLKYTNRWHSFNEIKVDSNESCFMQVMY